MLGLQKATGIGADPRAEALRQMDNTRLDASIPNPENKGMGALDALSRMVRQYTGPVQETLGEIDPQFTPKGGEGMFNTPRVNPSEYSHIPDAMYQRVLEKFGMGKK